MTDKNADVEWLRATFGGYLPPEFNAFATREVYFMQMRRLLAHIDELEAEATKFRAIDEEHARLAHTQKDRRPTVHEIAAQIYAPMMRGMEFAPWAVRFAEFAYTAAEALVAEGRRRDGRNI